MTRPRKQTVDYFPHSCHHGKTMFILEQRFGNDGYAFWFKLLELLGETEGHSLNCGSDLANWHFLCTRARVDDGVANEILNLLADVEAIDKELWENSRIIWSDNFVKGLAFAYRNRGVTIPVKPVIYTTEPGISGKEGIDNRKGKGSKGKGSKGNKDIAPPGPSDAVGAVLFFSCPYFDVDLNYRFKLAKEYPALTDDLLRKELSKMEDWISDNAQKKKFKANGHLANPKLFIKNWLDKVGGIFGPGADKPKGFAAVQRWAEKGETHG